MERPLVRFTRDIPLPYMLGVLAALALFLIGMFYGLRDVVRVQTDMASDVKSIKEELKSASRENLQMSYQLGDLSRRVTILEAQQKGK